MMSYIGTALISIVCTLLTILLTPRLQHYFWAYQRMSELRMNAYKELNELSAEFLINHINNAKLGTTYQPTDNFFKRLQALTLNIKVVFSEAAFKEFKKFEIMIGPNLGPNERNASTDAYISALESSLKKLQSEAVVEMGLAIKKLARQLFSMRVGLRNKTRQ
jgi:hypothetical protein